MFQQEAAATDGIMGKLMHRQACLLLHRLAAMISQCRRRSSGHDHSSTAAIYRRTQHYRRRHAPTFHVIVSLFHGHALIDGRSLSLPSPATISHRRPTAQR